MEKEEGGIKNLDKNVASFMDKWRTPFWTFE